MTTTNRDIAFDLADTIYFDFIDTLDDKTRAKFIIKDIDNNNSYEFISKISKFKDYSIKQIDSNCLIKYPWDYIKESGKSINKQYEFFNQRSGNKKNIKFINNFFTPQL